VPDPAAGRRRRAKPAAERTQDEAHGTERRAAANPAMERDHRLDGPVLLVVELEGVAHDPAGVVRRRGLMPERLDVHASRPWPSLPRQLLDVLPVDAVMLHQDVPVVAPHPFLPCDLQTAPATPARKPICGVLPSFAPTCSEN
jgi:hypothetical protein